MQETNASQYPTPAEALRPAQADTPATCRPEIARNPPTSPLHKIAVMLEQLVVKHKPSMKVKAAIEEIQEVAKKAVEEEKDAHSHVLCNTVMLLHESLKADLLVVQNTLATKFKELENDHKKLILTTDSLSKTTDSLQTTTRDLENKVVKVNDTTDKLASTTMSYRDAFMANPNSMNRPNTDPKVLSGIDKKARQILIGFDSLTDNPTLGACTGQLRDKANDIIKNLDGAARPKDIYVGDVARTRDGSLLLLLDSKESADWLREFDIEDKFTEKFAPGACIRERKYNILMRWVPITLDTKDRKHHREIEEVNGLPTHSIQSTRWIKPVIRRRAGQTRAHAVFTVNNAEVANWIIKDGIDIFGTRPKAEKTKQEPTQCLKCRGWEHKAQDCTADKDVCGTCGDNHRTSTCNNKSSVYCASCKTNDHASWDRACPEFIRRCAIYNERHPENNMVYFPTEQDWTLTTRPDRIPLEERFPKHFANNIIPVTNCKSPKSLAQASTGKEPGTNSPPKTHMRRNPEQQPRNSNTPVNSFMNRTGSNLVPLGRSREAGEPSAPLDHESQCDQSDTSLIDRVLDLDESSHAFPGKWP